MNVVVDACSLINLSNAGALDLVCRLRRCRLWLCSGVAGECEGECAAQLLTLAARGLLPRIDDADVPASRVLELLEHHGLGDGETEAIVAAEALGHVLCSDDKPARKLGRDVLGASRVIGSLRILRWCVEEQLIDCGHAFGMFGIMRDQGGFLPKTEQAFFCAGVHGC